MIEILMDYYKYQIFYIIIRRDVTGMHINTV
jgi:hypothetical protein